MLPLRERNWEAPRTPPGLACHWGLDAGCWAHGEGVGSDSVLLWSNKFTLEAGVRLGPEPSPPTGMPKERAGCRCHPSGLQPPMVSPAGPGAGSPWMSSCCSLWVPPALGYREE